MISLVTLCPRQKIIQYYWSFSFCSIKYSWGLFVLSLEACTSQSSSPILPTSIPPLWHPPICSLYLCLLSFCLCFFFLIPCISEIIWCLSFSVELISLSTTQIHPCCCKWQDFIFFQIGLFGVFLAIELYEFFIHFGYKFLLRYIIFKCFLSSLGCLFHFVDGFLCCTVAFEFGVVPLVYFCFCCLCFWRPIKVITKKNIKVLTAYVFFQEFYGFRFNIQVFNPFDYFLCSVTTQFPQHHLLKGLAFSFA